MLLSPFFNLLVAMALLAKTTSALSRDNAEFHPVFSRDPMLGIAKSLHERDGSHLTPTMEDCDLDFADEWTAGRSLGAPVCASQIKKGLLVKGFYVWTQDPNYHPVPSIMGIRVLYSNGDYTDIGRMEGESRYVEWDVEKVTVKKVNLDPPDLSWNDRLRSLRIVTTDGQEVTGGYMLDLNWGAPHSDSEWDEHRITPIHGPLVGVAGKTGYGVVESLTFYTLNAKARNSFVHDVTFSPSLEEVNARDGSEAKGLRRDSILVGHAVNNGTNGDPDVVLHMRKIFSHRKAKSWGYATTHLAHIGASIEVQYESDVLVNKFTAAGKLETFWQGSWTKETMESTEDFETSEMWIDVTVRPRQVGTITAYFVTGELERNWKGKNTMEFENGKKVTFEVTGTLKESRYSEGWFHIEYTEWNDGVAAMLKGESAISSKGVFMSKDDTARTAKSMQERDKIPCSGGYSVF